MTRQVLHMSSMYLNYEGWSFGQWEFSLSALSISNGHVIAFACYQEWYKTVYYDCIREFRFLQCVVKTVSGKKKPYFKKYLNNVCEINIRVCTNRMG